jgi:hypothetical protein
LTPVAKSGGKPFATRTGLQGEYTFLSVPEGLYILTASRRHYFPASYGQRLPQGRGTPLEVKEDGKVYVELHMRRMGAISGHILDENGIGLSDIPVIAYRAKLPLRIAATAISDDRGIYRMHGMLPGKYWIRTGAHTLEDGTTMLPTFSPEAREAHESRAYAVLVDSETTDADIRPMPGALFHLGGTVQCEPMGAPVSVRLSSETGTRTATTVCGQTYQFAGLAPGGYEVLAEVQGGRIPMAGFVELFLDRDSETGTIRAGEAPLVQILDERTHGLNNLTLTGQRQDLAGPGTEIEIHSNQRVVPGNWEVSTKTGPNDYTDSITSYGGGARRQWRPERSTEAFEVFIGGFVETIRVVLANTAGHLTGTVQADSKPVAGIPVFLWPVAESERRSLRGFVQKQSDVNGVFQFDGLPPGDYRIVASYDLTEVDEESVELAKAVTVRVEKSQTATADLAPWLSPY